MSDLLEELLQTHGPCLSTDLTRLLIESQGLTADAARKRVSRRGLNVRRLAYIAFPRNVRFMYLQKDFGSPDYWDRLIKALLDTGSAYGLALAALRQRGGIMPSQHFPIACGAPLRQSKHLSPETILERLQKAQLLGTYDVPGVGPCIALVQGPDRYDAGNDEIRARLVTEAILLKAVRSWVQRLGLGSYDRVALRDETAEQPKVGTFSWDLSAPSYLGPMLDWSAAGRPKPGFIVCDVLLGVEVDEAGLRPFIYKSTTLRSLGRVGRCLQVFVAERYTQAAFELAKKNGIVPATPDSLFGREVAEGLSQLVQLLTQAAHFAIRPEVFGEVFARLDRIEGAATNLRGALFEFIAAEMARQMFSQHVRINAIFKAPNGEKAEVDVLAEKSNQSVTFIECKGYQPLGTVPDSYLEKWLEKTIPLVYQEARRHPDWRSLKLHFEFWTTGRLSPEAIAMISNAQKKIRPSRYTINYRDAEAVHTAARELGDKGLLQTLEQHFLEHPMATAERDVGRRMVRSARSLASKEAMEDATFTEE
jgi:hypothetical protein